MLPRDLNRICPSSAVRADGLVLAPGTPRGAPIDMEGRVLPGVGRDRGLANDVKVRLSLSMSQMIT